MPTRPSTNVVAKYLEFPPELAEAVQAFADARGETFKAVVMHALRRHLAFPPSPPVPEVTEPLPPEPASPPTPPKRGRPKKNA